MRPALRWAGAATVAASLGVSCLHDAPAVSAPATARAQGSPPQSTPRVAAEAGDLPKALPVSSNKPLAQRERAREPWQPMQPAEQAAWVPPLVSPLASPAPRPPPPASPATDEVPPPAPPPAFAHQWLGQLIEDGKTRVFLAGPQRTQVLAVGETMADGWRIDGVQDGQLQLTWLATGAAINVAARP